MNTAEDHQPPPNLKQRLKQSYDSIAPIYNAWTAHHGSLRLDFLLKLLKLLPKDEGRTKILELGCGCGIPVTKALLAWSPTVEVVANDLSSTQIARENLSEYVGRVEFVEGDMLDLSLPEDSLDAVVGLYSLIHLPREEQSSLLGKIYRWLRPGGCVLANFAVEEMCASVKQNWLDEKGWMFWSGWGKEKTVDEVNRVGFELLSTEATADVVDASFLWLLARKREGL